MLNSLSQSGVHFNPLVPARITNLEIDEMGSFVGNKANQRWLCYAFDLARKKIICLELGRRTDDSCKKLLGKLLECQVTHLKRLQKKTICFSRADDMHEAVMKLYIRHLNAVQHLL